MQERFRWLGFSNNRSKILEKWLNSDEIFKHRNDLYWAECYIKTELELWSCNLLLRDFPFQPDKISKEFNQNADANSITCKNSYYEIWPNAITIIENTLKRLDVSDTTKYFFMVPI